MVTRVTTKNTPGLVFDAKYENEIRENSRKVWELSKTLNEDGIMVDSSMTISSTNSGIFPEYETSTRHFILKCDTDTYERLSEYLAEEEINVIEHKEVTDGNGNTKVVMLIDCRTI